MTIVNILSIAGSDPSGGAGIQADLKSIAANGGYGMAAITALTAQNTHGVTGVHTPPPEFLAQQLDAVATDVRIDAVKIGMLASSEIIDAVAAWLERTPVPHVVLDPVMIATSGDRLLDEDTAEALQRLIRLADLITPNLPELAIVARETVAADWAEALDQARRVAADTGVRVLAKGGHLTGDEIPDAIVTPAGETVEFPGGRIRTDNTHGTGCSLSSAVATLVARHDGDWEHAVSEAKAWLRESLTASGELEVGSGHGPLNHFAGLWARSSTTVTPDTIRDDWWARIERIREETDDLRFIRTLADGTLDRADFLHYVEQDSLYLGAYARVLARVSAMAPTPEEQSFWANSAQNAIYGELELHKNRLGHVSRAEPSAVTKAYIDHELAATTRSYEEAAAAALPCFWMYADIGARIKNGGFGEDVLSEDHPYAEWVATYDDPAFAAANEKAIEYVTNAAASATPDMRERMWRTFEVSAVWERDFFGQTAADA